MRKKSKEAFQPEGMLTAQWWNNLTNQQNDDDIGITHGVK
jgi:hypothetical protein